jgi:hypothetical protein
VDSAGNFKSLVVCDVEDHALSIHHIPMLDRAYVSPESFSGSKSARASLIRFSSDHPPAPVSEPRKRSFPTLKGLLRIHSFDDDCSLCL